MEADSEFPRGGGVRRYDPHAADPTMPRPSQGPLKRLRVSRACDRCKRRKVRCSGNQPCDICMRDATSCVYAAPYNRGRRSNVRRPSVPSSSSAAGVPPQDPPAAAHNRRGDTRPPPAGPSHHQRPISRQVEDESDAGVGETPSRESPELVTDLQGHYVGPASGVSFLARVQKRLHYGGNHTSSTFTFGDTPLPDYDPTPSVMISAGEGLRLLQRFFHFTVPIDRLLHRPTIESTPPPAAPSSG
ncbi:hypothetical protein VTK73DRAFT_3043 [Phialemonium thermophilum]|uniref:Zn(2)-C6 fungal-type domain-containing protein n=1 Tax=Phialemonium thermophilum TaxID=223376 RepID=A0ABR3VLL6_9PEZI